MIQYDLILTFKQSTFILYQENKRGTESIIRSGLLHFQTRKN